MIDFAETLGAIALGTIIPVYVALYLVSSLKSSDSKKLLYVTALGLGILLYFFVDVTLDSTELGVNSGFSFGSSQIFLLISFVLGILILSAVEMQGSSALTFSQSRTFEKTSRGALFLVPALIALGIGVHGAGEGSSFAYVASGTTYTTLVDAFGGATAIVSYVLHKFLEAIVVGAAYFAYVKCSYGKLPAEEPQEKPSQRSWEIPVLGALLWIPSVFGTTIGYFASINPVYFYAFASGASVYAILRVGRPLFGAWSEVDDDKSSRVKVSILVLIGFLLLYFAALFHSG